MNRNTLVKRIRDFDAFLREEMRICGNPYGGITECAVDEAKQEKAEAIHDRFRTMFKGLIDDR